MSFAMFQLVCIKKIKWEIADELERSLFCINVYSILLKNKAYIFLKSQVNQNLIKFLPKAIKNYDVI
jgi:hypothetical protein